MAQATARLTLPDRYRVVGHIANGGMASVWEAHDVLLDRPVAVKVLAAHLSEDERARRRFAREARAAAGLSSHPHVVTIYDVAELEGQSFIVMELLRGGTVADKLRAGDEIGHSLALRWLREAGSALDAAHEAGIVHRDVKPANMLLDTRPGSAGDATQTSRLALADFGIARLGLEDQITQTGQVLGTAAYISPEQAMGQPSAAASDRYALAVVAFELLTGERPFAAENFAAQARAHVEDEPPLASERAPRLPRAVDEVLARGMAKTPEDRFPTAGVLVQALEEALDEPGAPREATAPAGVETTHVMSDPTPPPAAPARPARPARPAPAAAPPARPAAPGRALPAADAPRRRWGPRGLIALGALLLVTAVLVAVLTSSGRDPEPQGAAQQAEATATPEQTSTPDEPEPTATATPTEEPAAEEEQEPAPAESEETQPGGGGGGGGLGNDPVALQARAFELNNAGNPQRALRFARKAVSLCEGSSAVSPCAYALFEYARALRLTGDPQGAIAALEERKERFPDDQPEAVEEELALAREAAGGS